MVRMDREIRILTDAAAVANPRRRNSSKLPPRPCARKAVQRSARRRIDAQSTLQSPGN